MNLNPVNLQEEKKKFFFDPEYNPQFIFEQVVPDGYLHEKYGEFGGELANEAKSILDQVIKKWSAESDYLANVEGQILSRDASTQIIKDYLLSCGLEDKVQLHFSKNFIPRTHIDGMTMNIRLPTEYREKGISGMLHHEIGTHVYRRLNDYEQIWVDKRKKFSLKDYLESEEGLATLHYYLDLEDKSLWIYALQYYACFLAVTMSFSQVYAELKPYIDDKERRFKVTLRAKRGLADTSKAGGYTKDQVYLRGVKKISNWLKENDFDTKRFYIGKIALEDIDRVWQFNPAYTPKMPPFILNDPESYKKNLQKILKVNGFL